MKIHFVSLGSHQVVAANEYSWSRYSSYSQCFDLVLDGFGLLPHSSGVQDSSDDGSVRCWLRWPWVVAADFVCCWNSKSAAVVAVVDTCVIAQRVLCPQISHKNWSFDNKNSVSGLAKETANPPGNLIGQRMAYTNLAHRRMTHWPPVCLGFCFGYYN